jgi:guanylate kinase
VNRERELAVSKERISNPGFLVILTGGTAVGKTELKERLAGKYSDIKFLVTTTTREPRLEKGERDGVDYHFIKRDKFAEMIDNNEFVEFASYDGNSYGTTKKEVNQIFEGKNLISSVEISGAANWNDNVRKAYSKEVAEKIITRTIIVLIEADEDSQRVRSQRRSMGNVGNLEERLLEDKILMEQYGTLFDNRIRNDEDKIEESLESLENLILKSFKDTKITF